MGVCDQQREEDHPSNSKNLRQLADLGSSVQAEQVQELNEIEVQE
jgi:hypothetical protein